LGKTYVYLLPDLFADCVCSDDSAFVLGIDSEYVRQVSVVQRQPDLGTRRKNTFFLSAITTVGIFIVNIFGFVDTETGSALGCGHDWPMCQGGILPTTWTFQAIIEWSHRMVVFGVGLLLFATAIIVWRRFRAWFEIRVLIGFAVGGVILESMFGALGVLLPDPPWLLALHLGVAILAFTGSLLMTLAIRQIEHSKNDLLSAGLRPLPFNTLFRRYAWISVVYTYVAMYYGAFVANTGDGGLFQGWPFPTEHYADVHLALFVDIGHRTFALGLLLLIIRLLVFGYRSRKERPDLYKGSMTALVLVCLQAFSGGYLIYSHLSAPAFITHVSIVSCLFATLCYLSLQMSPNRLPAVQTRKNSVDNNSAGNNLGGNGPIGTNTISR
jgi:heme a synthase